MLHYIRKSEQNGLQIHSKPFEMFNNPENTTEKNIILIVILYIIPRHIK